MYRYELALNINYLIMSYKIGIIDMKWIAIHKPSIANYDQGIQKENSKEWKPSCISLYSTWESKKKKKNQTTDGLIVTCKQAQSYTIEERPIYPWFSCSKYHTLLLTRNPLIDLHPQVFRMIIGKP